MEIKPCRLLIVIFLNGLYTANAASCDLAGGRSELILDVTESHGTAFDQPVEPQVLPIEGEPEVDVTLELSEAGKRWLSLHGKTLSLTKPLDRDEENLSTLRFEIRCIVRSSGQIRTIPVVVRIRDVNDNPPEFKGAPYHVAVKEDTAVNTIIFKKIRASDRDSGSNGQLEYKILDIFPDPGTESQLFSIRFPHQGVVFLMSPLDYETTALYRLTIGATDLSKSTENRLNATTTLTIRVQDVDDQDPVFDTAENPENCSTSGNSSPFCAPEYYSSVTEREIAGVLDIYPGRIHAKDLDTIGSSIVYSFKEGFPDTYDEYFEIDSRTATVKQIKRIDRTHVKSFEIVILATENSPRRGRSTARLKINVLKVDTSPPKLVIPAYTGKVPEASLPGTPVLMDDGTEVPFKLSVFDPDVEIGEDPPPYVFELTTSAFTVSEEGILQVAVPNLDRDLQGLSELTFQAIAREDREGGSASAPVSLTVRLLDINDNPPRLPIIPAVTIPAGSQRRNVIQIKATDSDEGANAIVKYELLNGGRGKFSLDPQTGLLTAVGDLNAGEDFLLNIKATDIGNLSSEGFVEVVVSRGPNTDGPVFFRAQYSVTVSEDIAHGEEILVVQAKDPEEDVSYYSITDGNIGKSFEMDTLTGSITVVAPLDREKQDQYYLTVVAEDSEGKNNSAKVIVKVTDVNDEAPSFVGEPFSFRVDEGLSNAPVGIIKAEDNDLGAFGKVSFRIEEKDSPFKINAKTGEIFTNSSLDYEINQVHYLSVVAHDMADDELSNTATVTVLVNDVSDELPFFPKDTYSVRVPENTDIGSVIATVGATDMDTVPSITYKIISSNSRLFKIASDTGRLTITGNLDFETMKQHKITVGTVENNSNSKGARATVIVDVDDVNDEAPSISFLGTVTLSNEAPIGTLLVTVAASDKDGTSPNNQVKFSFGDQNETTKTYFSIDEETGEIRLKKLLMDSSPIEFIIKVIATDGGDPPLSSSAEFRVLLLKGSVNSIGSSSAYNIDSSGENMNLAALASSPRFSRNKYELQLKENLPVGEIVLKVPLTNTTSSAITCSIVQGNFNASFATKMSHEGNCKIITTKPLDFERIPNYNLSLILRPEEFALNEGQDVPVLSKAVIMISVLNLNDNSPKFVLNDFDIILNENESTVLAYVLQDSPPNTDIIELKALDLDSGSDGLIEYKLLPESNRGNYFSVDSKSGRVYTKRKLHDVPLELLPFNLVLIAKDKPGIEGMQHVSKLRVIVPLIEKVHQSVLILNSSKEALNSKLDDLKKSIQSSTDRKVQFEDIRQVRKNGRKELQVWFHLLEHDTWKPVDTQKAFKEEGSELVLKEISNSLNDIAALRLISPLELQQELREDIRKESIGNTESEGDVSGIVRVQTALGLTTVEYALIALAAVIVLFVVIAMIVVCVLWTRFSKKWNSADKTVMLIPPVIEQPAPPGSVLESLSKEYEVQVLHMSVPLDDDSTKETTPEAESPRQVYLDNVSYISKARTGIEDSSSGGSSGLATPNPVDAEQCGDVFPVWSPQTPFLRDNLSNSLLDDSNNFSASLSNENVMFGRRGMMEVSPVETTTEL